MSLEEGAEFTLGEKCYRIKTVLANTGVLIGEIDEAGNFAGDDIGKVFYTLPENIVEALVEQSRLEAEVVDATVAGKMFVPMSLLEPALEILFNKDEESDAGYVVEEARRHLRAAGLEPESSTV